MDIVWDFYLADSSKAAIRSKRGQGQRGKVLPLASLPSNWKSFLRNDENKGDLFSFLSKEIERTQGPGKIQVSTSGDSVVSLSTESDLTIPVDARVFLHATDCVKQGQTIRINELLTLTLLYLQSLLLRK